MKRVIFDVIIFLSIFFLPWWVTFLLVTAGLFIFTRFYEFIFVAIFLYAIFVSPYEHVFWYARPFWSALIVIGLYLGVESLRRFIIFYRTS